MKLFYKLVRQDPNTREGVIAATSLLGAAVNVLIAGVKVVIGLMTSSIAILSEGVNSATDAATSVLALVGTRLAAKHPSAKHPFGYGRIEYLTSLVISVLILVGGGEMLLSSVKLIFTPAELSISVLSLVIVALSAAAKLALALYTIKMGKKTDSSALVGVGMESRNDSISSVITIVSSLVFLLFGFSVDAYAGILISVLILKTGIELLLETVSQLLGKPGDKELADTLYKEIRSTEGVLAAADMMLHNYGPDACSGSVNVEIDHRKTVGEVYGILHTLQLRIMHQYHVTMVFGVYAMDNDSEKGKALRRVIAEFVHRTEHVRSFHAVFPDPASGKLYCDLVVDYELRDWDKLHKEFCDYMAQWYPETDIELTVETDYV